MIIVKINELLKGIREHRREANYNFQQNYIKVNLAAGVGSDLKKEFIKKNKYFLTNLSENVIKGDYLPILMEKRTELENMAKQFLESNNAVEHAGEHSLASEEYNIELGYELHYSILETDEELERKRRYFILKDFQPLFSTTEAYELFDNLFIDSENVFSILHENFEYKFKIKTDKLKDKILKETDSQKLYQIIISSALSIDFVGVTNLNV